MKKYKTPNGYDAIIVPFSYNNSISRTNQHGFLLLSNDRRYSSYFNNYAWYEHGFEYGWWASTMDELLKIVEEQKTFPREMLVTNSDGTYVWTTNQAAKRTVVCDLGENFTHRYVAIHCDRINGKHIPVLWRYAREVDEEPEVLELTLDDIAEKYNVSVDKIKIKK